ncbi:MAG TPA: lipopolysaccharide core heptose(I) kinase RfaP [Crenotrichaceae bacterium]|nr:lipopolysaccharide core heptose(I) kinase RfaP [Crenotrichaceae bacterium]
MMKLFTIQRLELEETFQAGIKPPLSFDQILQIEGQIYKSADNRKTIYFQMNDKDYFIKIHDGVGWREIFKNLFIGRLPVISAQNEYKAILKLAELNIDSLQFVGFGQRGYNPARLQSFVITKALMNHISLATLCQDWTKQPPAPIFKRYLINQVATITRRLHRNGINHRDLYLCHFLIKRQYRGDDGFPPIHLIDLHRVQIRSKTPYRWRVKDLTALYFSSMDIGLSNTDRLRFIRSYTDYESLRGALKNSAELWKQVKHKANLLYKKHNNQ